MNVLELLNTFFVYILSDYQCFVLAALIELENSAIQLERSYSYMDTCK